MLPALALALLAATSRAEPCASPPPAGFVDLSTIPGLRLDIGYHTPANFTGAPLPGYAAPGAWLLAEPAASLAALQAQLAAEDLGLLVYDAYRPRRASEAMAAWAARTDNAHLLRQGYIARNSGHNHGHTVDLTLVDLATGAPLPMGTPWDDFSAASHTASAAGEAAANRQRLQRAMIAAGWRPYSKEWWHFRYPLAGTSPRDVPYGCCEPAEGRWRAPEGWAEMGYEAAAAWPPCPPEPTRADPLPAPVPDGPR